MITRALAAVALVALCTAFAAASSVSFQFELRANPHPRPTAQPAPAPSAPQPSFSYAYGYYPYATGTVVVPPQVYVPPLLARPVAPPPQQFMFTPNGIVAGPAPNFYSLPQQYPGFLGNGLTTYDYPLNGVYPYPYPYPYPYWGY